MSNQPTNQTTGQPRRQSKWNTGGADEARADTLPSSCLSCFLLNTFWFLSFNLHVLSIIHLFLDTCNSPKSPSFHPGHFMRTLIENWHNINQTHCEMYSCIWSDFDSFPCLTFNFLNVYPSAFPSLSILFSISPLLPSYHLSFLLLF